MITVDTPAGELHVRAPMVHMGPARSWQSWYVDGPIEVASSPDGRWSYLRADWYDLAEDALRRHAAEGAAEAAIEGAEVWR